MCSDALQRVSALRRRPRVGGETDMPTADASTSDSFALNVVNSSGISVMRKYLSLGSMYHDSSTATTLLNPIVHYVKRLVVQCSPTTRCMHRERCSSNSHACSLNDCTRYSCCNCSHLCNLLTMTCCRYYMKHALHQWNFTVKYFQTSEAAILDEVNK